MVWQFRKHQHCLANAKTDYQQYGKPIYKYHDDDGYEVYEYVERIYVGNAVVEQNYYYFFIKNGVVQKKGQKVENPPAWSESYNSDPILDFQVL